MEAMKQFKLRRDIRDTSEDLRTTLSDLYKWEKEIKEQEKCRVDDGRNEKKPPVRSWSYDKGSRPDPKKGSVSSVDNAQKEKVKPNPVVLMSEAQELANTYKEKGNNQVKIGEYEQAILCYTDAINKFNEDPIYYTNRALCYLKLERYNECIEDCNRALMINSKTVKALYRRMQAKESLGEHQKALEDCKEIIKIDPKNTEAKKSLERISKRLNNTPIDKTISFKRGFLNKPPPKPSFTTLKSNMIEVKPITKPAHLRSKKPLKRIQITETIVPSSQKDSKDYENSSIASTCNGNISDEIVDKLFNSNEFGNFTEIRKNDQVQMPPIESPRMNISLPPVPQSPAMFYVAWKELGNEDKYLYLKSIDPGKLNHLMGASFDYEMLSEILSILKKYYVKDDLDVVKILKEIGRHSEMPIIALFLNSTDKLTLSELIEYIQRKKSNEDDVAFIKSKFKIEN